MTFKSLNFATNIFRKVMLESTFNFQSLPKGCNIAFYGGSFDPPHIGHQAIIKAAQLGLEIDMLIVMMAYQNPLKSPARFSHSLRFFWMQDICTQINQACPHPPVILSDYEVQNKIFFTFESIEYIKRLVLPKKIYLILGADNLASLKEWEGYESLKKNVEFVFVKRKGFVYNISDFKELIIDVPEGISSSLIRQKYKDNVDELRSYLVPSTAESILQALRE